MSSHHFVKEGQEPTLIIFSANTETQEFVGNLLEWSPEVWVCDRALNEVLAWGIKIDGVILKFEENQELPPALSEQEPFQEITYDFDIITQGLSQLLKVKNKSISLVDAEKLLGFHSLESYRVEVLTLFRNHEKWSLIKSGQWKKWLPKHSEIRIFAEGKENKHQADTDGYFSITKQGLFWIGESTHE